MKYVEAFVMPVPTKNLKIYASMAKIGAKIWLDHGAIDYQETVLDKAMPGKLTFPGAVKVKKGETVVLSWIVYTSEKHKNAVMAKVMKDKRLGGMLNPKKMPFDATRIIRGEFKVLAGK